MYTGTLYGHWEAIVTFQQMIVLSDADGIVDMTPQGICGCTSIPLEIITKGIEVLSAPDPFTRTPGAEGRRIELIDAHRPWGWHIVNHEKYKLLVDAETVREQNKERQRRHRAKQSEDSNAPSRSVTPSNDANAPSRHTDTDTDTRKPLPPSGAFLRFWAAWPKNVRKHSKGKCWETWMRKDFDLQAEVIHAHVEALKASSDWKRENGRYVPAPFVYLNQRRWEGAETKSEPARWTP